MDYLLPPHRILRYLAKIEKSGFFYAHLKCMKDGSNDLEKLKDFENRRIVGAEHSLKDGVGLTDGEIDINKLKTLFIEREYMTAPEFDTAIQFLRNNNYIDPIKCKATILGVAKHTQMQSTEDARIKTEIERKRQVGDPLIPSKNPLI